MISQKNKRIAVIGAGISGIAAAKVLKKNGYEAVVFEKSKDIGGVWAIAYPEVRLQNINSQYHFSDFPWSSVPDLHPTQTQIIEYLHAAVNHFEIDVRCKHEVLALEEIDNGWLVRFQNQDGSHEENFEYVLVAIGQYNQKTHLPIFPGQEEFTGEILTERDIKSFDIFNDKCVAVIGFGKSALDMSVYAAQSANQVHHIFRTPRWLIPLRIFGIHYTKILFSRINSAMVTSWAHPTMAERFLHSRLKFIVSGFWSLIELILRLQVKLISFGKDKAAASRLKTVQPTHKLLPDLRSATALAPNDYYKFVAEGRIQPHHTKLSDFSAGTINLDNTEKIECDSIVLCLGSQTPAFPFLPQKYQHLWQFEDGVQLYRHLIHPRIPNLGFVGFNHGFLHVPSVEIGTLWLCAYLEGELELPSVEQMEQDIEEIRQWKEANIHFESSRGCGVNTRYQKYIDILLRDLEVSPYRKMPNIFAEMFGMYNCSDYQDVLKEYNYNAKNRTAPLRPLPVTT